MHYPPRIQSATHEFREQLVVLNPREGEGVVELTLRVSTTSAVIGTLTATTPIMFIGSTSLDWPRLATAVVATTSLQMPTRGRIPGRPSISHRPVVRVRLRQVPERLSKPLGRALTVRSPSDRL